MQTEAGIGDGCKKCGELCAKKYHLQKAMPFNSRRQENVAPFCPGQLNTAIMRQKYREEDNKQPCLKLSL